MAVDVLLEVGQGANGEPRAAGCVGLVDIVRAATPGLVKRLGVPGARPRIPRSVNGDEPDWARALQALSIGGADRAVAEKAVEAFLADDATAPLAALALARMGVDVAAVVPQLARILDGIALHDAPPLGPHYWDELEQSGDVLDALRAIGKPAHSALPNVAALILRSEVPRCATRGAFEYARVVGAIVTAADLDDGVACLAPLLTCPGSAVSVLRGLGELGAPARPWLLAVLRDDKRTIGERLEAVIALRHAGQMTLEDPDGRLLTLLQAKRTAWAELIHSRAARATTAAIELGRCRAEAGLTPGLEAVPDVSWDSATCLTEFLCGPTLETYLHTMERCLFGKYFHVDSPPGAAGFTMPVIPSRAGEGIRALRDATRNP